MSPDAIRLGLTGGIGSGKSTVARFLAEAGAAVIDADAISRTVTAAGGAAIPSLVQVFGSEVVTPEGALDREKMRHIAFNDPGAKRQLETIVHPIVGREIAAQADVARSAGVPCIVFDIPLLVESQHWRPSLDRILVVDCLERTQVERVKARSQLSEIEIFKIMAAQAPRSRRLQAADCILFNDGIDLEELKREVLQIGAQFGL